VLALGGRIALENREERGEPEEQSTQDGAAQVIGLDAVVHLPLSRHNS
jgi:two-component system sensor histidine kinase TctE